MGVCMAFEQLVFFIIQYVIIYFFILLAIFTVGNFFEAWFAKLAGDNTPEYADFFTLNPLAHVNWVNLLMIILTVVSMQSILEGRVADIFLSFCFILASSYAVYTVPVNMDNFKYPILGSLLFAVSCSVGLLSLGIVFGFGTLAVLHFLLKVIPGYMVTTFASLAVKLINFSFFWAIVQCIPLPPFHAGNVLIHLLPKRYEYVGVFLSRYAIFTYLFLFFMPGVDAWFFSLIGGIVNKLTIFTGYFLLPMN